VLKLYYPTSIPQGESTIPLLKSVPLVKFMIIVEVKVSKY